MPSCTVQDDVRGYEAHDQRHRPEVRASRRAARRALRSVEAHTKAYLIDEFHDSEGKTNNIKKQYGRR